MQDQPGSALTNNNAFSTIALPCWNSHTALQGSKTIEVNLICFIIAVCPCPLLRTENSADRVLEGESQGVTIRRWWTSGGGSYDGLGTICDIQNHSPFLTLVYSLSLKWIAFLSVPCSSDYVIPYLRLKSIRGWNLGKCKLKEPLFSRHPSTNQPSPA